MTIEVLDKFLIKALESCENTPKEINKGANASKEHFTDAAKDVKEEDVKVEDEQVAKKK